MSCIITYKGQKYSEEQFKEYFINNKQEFATSIAKNKDVIDSFKRKMEGIDYVFSQSPELASIGSKAQYLQYLSTIFKTSKIKDIVYHVGYNNIEKFIKRENGIYFTDNLDYAKNLIIEKIKSDSLYAGVEITTEEAEKQLKKYIVILNSKNILKIPKVNSQIIKDLNKENFDTIKGVEDKSQNIESYVVFEPEQIHLLGGKNDIEGFKEFVQGKQFQKLTAEEKAKTIEQVTKEHRSITALKDLAHKLAHRIGGKVEFENKTDVDWKGYNQGMTSVLNEAYMTPDTPFHEVLAHPIIRAIKNKNISKLSGTSKTDFTNLKGFGLTLNSKTDEWEVTYTTSGYDNDRIIVEKTNLKGYKNQQNAVKILKDYSSGNKKVAFENTSLYQNLLKELETGRGKEVLDGIKRDYKYKEFNKEEVNKLKLEINDFENDLEIFKDNSTYLQRTKEKIRENQERIKYLQKNNSNYTLEEQQEEAIVTLLGLMAAEKLDANKDATLISKLKELWKQISDFVKSLLRQDGIKIDELPITTTLNDLAEIMAYGNNKIILPGYKVEYSTPLGNKYDTLEEVNNEIKGLADADVEVDLSGVKVERKYKKVTNISEIPVKSFTVADEDFFASTEYYLDYDNIWRKREGYKSEFDDTDDTIVSDKEVVDNFNTYHNPSENYIEKFIEKNKEYEQSKEIIEEWKKENNIQYDPEEVYSRGQEFSSVVGAYSDFDVNLMLQNLLQHIEDNEKAGGKFAISVFTKPVDKTIEHLEGGGGKIKFKIFPKSEDILWAANKDVYSGSVWDASEKVNKDKKSELLGVSYTKYPSLENVKSVQPNLANIIDDIQWSHNELGISLNFSNFELEFDEDVPYKTKKIINSINKILKEKRGGELSKPKINTKYEDRYKNRGIIIQMNEANDIIEFHVNSEETRYSYQNNKYYAEPIFFGKFGNPDEELEITKKEYEDAIKKYLPYTYKDVVQPKITNETLKENIESVKSKLANDLGVGAYKAVFKNGNWVITDNNDIIISKEEDYLEPYIFDTKEDALEYINKGKNKEYTSQALINTKIAALKEVARKYPRSLITSKVVPINPNMVNSSEIQYSKVGSKQDIEGFKNYISQNSQKENPEETFNLAEQKNHCKL